MYVECVRDVIEKDGTLLVENGEVLEVTEVHTIVPKVILDGSLYFTPVQFKEHFKLVEVL